LGKRVVITDDNLTATANATASFHPITSSLLHAENAVDHQPQSTHGSARDPQQK
jgi:hypothetical protein